MPDKEKQQLLDSFQKALLEIRKGNIDLAHTLFKGLGEGILLKGTAKRFAEGLSLYGRAAVNLRRSSLTEAENFVRKAFTIFEELEEEIFSIKSNNILGLIYLDRGQYDKALQIFDRNLQEAKEGNFIEEKTIAHNNYGYCLILQGKYSEAKKSFQSGLELAAKHSFEQLEIGCYENLVLIARRTGDYREAQRLLKIAREKSELQGNEYYLMNVFHSLAQVAMDQGDYNRAIVYFERSLELAQKNKINRRLAQVLGDLGSLHHRTMELDKSLNYFEQSIELYEKLEIEDDIVEKLCEYSEALVSAGKLAFVTDVLNKAANKAVIHDSHADHAQLTFRLGLVQLYKGRYGLAKYFFKNALQYLENADLGAIKVRTYISLASLSLLPENHHYPTEAFNYVRAAYIAAKDQNLYPLLVDILLIQALLLLLHEKKFDEAEAILLDALAVAIEKGFVVDIMRIENRIKNVRSQRLIYEAYSAEERGNIIDELTKQDVLYEINRLAYNKEEIIGQKPLDPTETFIFTVKQAEKGPRYHIGANLPDVSKVSDRTFIKAGIIYSMALGSGHDYHLGFFGPFPFDNERKYTSLVYSTRINDMELMDKRMEHKNFVLICLVYPAEYRNVAHDINSMEKTVEQYLDKWQDVADITEADLDELRLEILKAFH
ncbi:MAG: tetratricopeptide repeat protein [Candidatus Odinarchaeota archaeon]